ncbi:MAG: hypothetical protein GXP55_20845 [Deltaproteobacteria bacterium]|nr:hypothetical protein [Deltaproteobacteria bacterium]
MRPASATHLRWGLCLLAFTLTLSGCGGEQAESDAGPEPDAGPRADAGDAGAPDAGTPPDAGPSGDASAPDSGTPIGPSDDRDLDGFDTSVDCDDADRRVYPSTQRACTAACGTGVQTCGADGTYSECSCDPLCEAIGTGRCYYISGASGDDTNPGTFDQPWATALNLNYYYRPPSTHVVLQPGDVVYFLEGSYFSPYACCDGDADQGIYLRGIDGTAEASITIRSYPGQAVDLTAETWDVMRFFGVSYLRIQGFDVHGGFGAGLRVSGDNLEFRDMRIHDVDGLGRNNTSGVVFLGATNVDFHHNELFDNYDRTLAAERRDHKQNIIAFRGGNIRIHHNEIYQTSSDPQIVNSGVLYKHMAQLEGSSFELDHNVFRNLAGFWAGSGTPRTHIHHNLVIDAGRLRVANFGGPTQNSDVVIDFNTMVGVEALSYNPNLDPAPGPFSYQNNIVIGASESYSGDGAFSIIGTYLGRDVYDLVVPTGTLSFGSNCYYNPNTGLRFGLFAALDAGDWYDLAGWQALGYDVDSIFADPMLDASYAPENPDCAMAGHLAGP